METGQHNDNLFIEQLWWIGEYGEEYLKAYQDGGFRPKQLCS
jgi:hypothetical protein